MSKHGRIVNIPKGSKRVQNGKPRCFWQFGTLLGPSGHFWAISDKNQFVAPQGQSSVWLRRFWAKNHFLFEMVQKGPDGPNRVPNGQKHLGWPFRPLLDPVGPLWNIDKPAMFGHFCLFYWCGFLGHPVLTSVTTFKPQQQEWVGKAMLGPRCDKIKDIKDLTQFLNRM